MSEAVVVALIVGGCNIAAQAVSRLLSHYEHQENRRVAQDTNDVVREMKQKANGKDD